VPEGSVKTGTGVTAVPGCDVDDAAPQPAQPMASPMSRRVAGPPAPGVSSESPESSESVDHPESSESSADAPQIHTGSADSAHPRRAETVADAVSQADAAQGLDAVTIQRHGLEHLVGPDLAAWHAIGSELAPRGSPVLGGIPEQSAAHLVVLQQQEVARRQWELLAAGMLERYQLRLGRWCPPTVGVRDPRAGWVLTSTLVEILTDPDIRLRVTRADALTGVTVARDPSVYRPNAALAQRVRDRDRTCRFPGCAVAARRCDLDHVVRHPEGATTEANLLCLCRTHHGFKHHAGWLLVMDAHGTCTWTAPTGRAYGTTPADVREHAA